MRALLATLVAAGLAVGGLVAVSSEADTPARARATALVADGSVGPRVAARARDGSERLEEDGIDMPALKVRAGEAMASTTLRGSSAIAYATAAARTVSVLEGRVTAYGVRRTVATDGGQTLYDGRVDGLRIGDRFIGDVTEAQSFDLPDGSGRVVVNTGRSGLRVVLHSDSDPYTAGIDIRVAVVRVHAVDGIAEPVAEPTPEASERSKAARKKRKRKGLPRRAAPAVRKRLTSGGFGFPVHGERVDTADDWGGPRQIGPHQGNDIFAPLGTPVLAVADGTVRKVGTLPISGNRLWVISDGGDAFFYAHMSAFSPEAVTGARVKAGTVLGFVGNTGDAEPTPPHLHFEIHPGGMDEDAVDPHPFLLAWRDRRDVPPGAWLQEHGEDAAQRPGALVEVRDFIAGE